MSETLSREQIAKLFDWIGQNTFKRSPFSTPNKVFREVWALAVEFCFDKNVTPNAAIAVGEWSGRGVEHDGITLINVKNSTIIDEIQKQIKSLEKETETIEQQIKSLRGDRFKLDNDYEKTRINLFGKRLFCLADEIAGVEQLLLKQETQMEQLSAQIKEYSDKIDENSKKIRELHGSLNDESDTLDTQFGTGESCSLRFFDEKFGDEIKEWDSRILQIANTIYKSESGANDAIVLLNKTPATMNDIYDLCTQLPLQVFADLSNGMFPTGKLKLCSGKSQIEMQFTNVSMNVNKVAMQSVCGNVADNAKIVIVPFAIAPSVQDMLAIIISTRSTKNMKQSAALPLVTDYIALMDVLQFLGISIGDDDDDDDNDSE